MSKCPKEQFGLIVFVHSLSSSLRLCDPINFSTSGFPVLQYLPDSLKLTSIESVMSSNHLTLCRPPSSHPYYFSLILVNTKVLVILSFKS